MRVTYQQAAQDDAIGQFRYYLVNQGVPEVAERFRSALRRTIESLAANPLMAAPCPLRNPRLSDLRSWPVVDFDNIRVYYIADKDVLRVIRVLHSKRNVRALLEVAYL